MTNARFDFIGHDNHMDNNLKESLVYVYYGSIVNNGNKRRSKKRKKSGGNLNRH